MLAFQVVNLFRLQEPLTVPLFRLMAATNDARYVMTQVIRGARGGRQPRNRAELYLVATEQFYLVRTLCGHLYEAATAFRTLWDNPKTRRRLRRAVEVRAGARERLDTLLREFDASLPDRLEARVLEPIRNHWAFHYRDSDYRNLLQAALDGGGNSIVVLADVPGRSRYVVIDDLVQMVVSGMCSDNTQAAHRREIVQPVVALAGALGVVVDTIVLSVLRARGVEQFKRRDVLVTLDRGLSRGYRDARARRLQREADGRQTR